MGYRIAVCDDDRNYAEHIEGYIKKFCSKCEKKVTIKVYTDGNELIGTIEKQNFYDLYLLDIEMPGCSGMDFLEELESRQVEAKVILLTAHTSYAVDAHEYSQVFRYIPKERFAQKMDAALTAFFVKMDRRLSSGSYIIKNKYKSVRIFPEEIVYIFKDRKYAVFVMDNGQKERERRGLQDIYNKLNNPNMIMMNRGLIINVRYVIRIQENEVTLEIGESIHASREHIMELKKVFNRLWGDEV